MVVIYLFGIQFWVFVQLQYTCKFKIKIEHKYSPSSDIPPDVVTKSATQDNVNTHTHTQAHTLARCAQNLWFRCFSAFCGISGCELDVFLPQCTIHQKQQHQQPHCVNSSKKRSRDLVLRGKIYVFCYRVRHSKTTFLDKLAGFDFNPGIV